MLVSMKETMAKAKKEGYCIPGVAVENEIVVRAAIAAAEERNSPIILISTPKGNPDIYYFGRIVSDLALRTRVPVSICQDHGATFEQAMMAIRAGFSDVMVDRSKLPFDENVAQVKEIVKIAHAVGVGVEAELGHVGVANNYAEDAADDTLTRPEEALRYVELTGVDTLAVAVGTAHGAYPKGVVPHIRFDLLKELNEKLPVPLVLHGGSGTGDENLSKAAQCGACKLNISNDLKRAVINGVKDLENVYRLWPTVFEAYKAETIHYIDVCGSANKI